MNTKKFLQEARIKVQHYAHRAVEHAIDLALWIARYVWKRYFNIETPLYKLWWKGHSNKMQRKLNLIHKNLC